ncbi:MAG: RdgB/HAM1 family non-canonical purine NTP pyrophosphatase [Eubacteriales bacterium]|nr:RdgB/HAM1 family non-canonical purine NTP pyrophosphatase [Eubacteriales bacterium]
MKIVLASHNKKKQREMCTLLKESACCDIDLLSPADIGFLDEPEENGKTFEENALIKAKAIVSRGYIAIADDSGLEVDALYGAPGIHSSRYSGGNDADNNAKLLRELAFIPFEKRTARFICVMVCVFPGSEDFITVRGSCEGIILNTARGDGGFGYDPLFYYEPLKRTFAELSDGEKNTVSHRGMAMRALARALPAELNSHVP